MRHTTAVMLAATLLLATGCGSGGGGGDDEPPKAKASPTVSKEDRYLKAAHAITFNGTPSDDELLYYPSQWCTALDQGHSVAWLFDEGDLYPVGDDWGTVQQDAYGLVVAAAKAYCPENAADVKAELRESGAY